MVRSTFQHSILILFTLLSGISFANAQSVTYWDTDTSSFSTDINDADTIDAVTNSAVGGAAIARDSNGIVYMAWVQSDGSNKGMYLARYDGTDVRIWDNDTGSFTLTFADGDIITPIADDIRDDGISLVVDSNNNLYFTVLVDFNLYLGRYNGTEVGLWDIDTDTFSTTFSNADSISGTDPVFVEDGTNTQLFVDSNDNVLIPFARSVLGIANNLLYLVRYDGTDVRIWDNGTDSFTDNFADGDNIDAGGDGSKYFAVLDSADKLYIFKENENNTIYLIRYDGTDVEIWDKDTNSFVDNFASGDPIFAGLNPFNVYKPAVDSQDRVYFAVGSFVVPNGLFLFRHDGTNLGAWDYGTNSFSTTLADADTISDTSISTGSASPILVDKNDNVYIPYRALGNTVYLAQYNGTTVGVWDDDTTSFSETIANADPVGFGGGSNDVFALLTFYGFTDPEGKVYLFYRQDDAGGTDRLFVTRYNGSDIEIWDGDSFDSDLSTGDLIGGVGTNGASNLVSIFGAVTFDGSSGEAFILDLNRNFAAATPRVYFTRISGLATDTEIEVRGNSAVISDGDTTPSASDDTDFGSADISSGSVSKTFTVGSVGINPLTLSGTPVVAISGTNAGDFTVTAQAGTPVAAGATTTFTVEFNPSATGQRLASVSIANDDLDENPYNFSIQGTGTAAPEIAVSGNSTIIADGDASPTTADHTEFGSTDISGGSVTRTFTISNSGSAALNLGGSPIVSLGGTNTADFSVTSVPSSSVAPGGGSTTFTVRFVPQATGVRTATISIINDDGDENPFNFSIRGTGIAAPEIAVSGNSTNIADGDATPTTADHTDFGSARVNNTTATRTFTISNSGSVALSLSGSPRVSVGGANAADFSVITAPSSTVAAGGGSTTFTVSFDPQASGTRTATLNIINDDNNENPFNFSIQGTGENGTDSDGDGTPDAADRDDDNDGVDDDQEALDGTDPLSPDSFIERFGTRLCVEWNGFLNSLVQILELRNTLSNTPIGLRVELFDIAGAEQSQVEFSLAGGAQFDIVVNDLVGFVAGSYGTICVTTLGGEADALDGQYVYYDLSDDGQTFNYSLVEEFLPARTGAQHLLYNNYYPTFTEQPPSNVTYSFIQISNEESTQESGDLVFYDPEGSEQRRIALSLRGGGRDDRDTHTLGTDQFGLVSWIPDDSTKKFRVRLNRYYQTADGLFSALSLPAQLGTGQKIVTPFETEGKIAVLEISNVSSGTVAVEVDTFLSDGTATSTQPSAVVLASKATTHLVLNNFLSSGLGNVTLDSDTVSSIVVALLEYGIEPNGTLKFIKRTSVGDGVGAVLRGSYNNFLGGCELRLGNRTSTEQQFSVAMTRFDGTEIINSPAEEIPASGAYQLNLCASETQQGYGEVSIVPVNPATFSGEVVRTNSDNSAEVGIPLRP